MLLPVFASINLSPYFSDIFGFASESVGDVGKVKGPAKIWRRQQQTAGNKHGVPLRGQTVTMETLPHSKICLAKQTLFGLLCADALQMCSAPASLILLTILLSYHFCENSLLRKVLKLYSIFFRDLCDKTTQSSGSHDFI